MAANAVAVGHDAHGAHDDHDAHHGHDEPQHDYHLVDPSPWPIMGAFSGLLLTGGGVMWMHEVGPGRWITLLGFLGVISTMVLWWRDVLKEGRTGHHKSVVRRGLRMGMVLFIVSEVLFFAAFFGAFFWATFNLPETVPTTWPPAGITPVPAWEIPFLNTMILLLSGATVTWAHHAIRENDQTTAYRALLLTVALGITFTSFQAYEYYHAIHEGFTLSDGIYGSSFYMATGFHGFHVIIGTTFLIVCTVRAYQMAFEPERHVGFEAASWYWHFVDVVWLFLFVWVYWWGGSLHLASNPPPV